MLKSRKIFEDEGTKKIYFRLLPKTMDQQKILKTMKDRRIPRKRIK